MILLIGKAKTHGMKEFMLINDRLRAFLMTHGGEMAFAQRSLNVKAKKKGGAVMVSSKFRLKKVGMTVNRDKVDSWKADVAKPVNSYDETINNSV